ncbi:MAG: metallophosphoesterase [Nitriliruptorales bacterium]|nr:metallophosphoesterase [Nitriliruptorales bacterium]
MEPFRFLFMADCQLGCYATFSGMTEEDVARFAARDMQVEIFPRAVGFEWDARQYEKAVAMANELDPAFVVMGGDMVDDPASTEQYREVLRITARLDPPMQWVPGNHDIGEDGDVPSPDSMARYRERFGADHYAFAHHDTTLIVVDTAVWVHAEKVPDEWERQLGFLRGALEEAAGRSGPVIVCGHHPLFTTDLDEPDSYWNVPAARRGLLLDLLADHDVSTYFCGHWHRNGGGRYRGLEVAVTGPVGYPLGDDPSGFRIVDVGPDGVAHNYVAVT